MIASIGKNMQPSAQPGVDIGADARADTSAAPVPSADGKPGVPTEVSTLAAQLALAAADAEARRKGSTEPLPARAERLLQQLVAQDTPASKAFFDAEVPNTSDPALLERARQATRFVNDHGVSEANPFAGLSMEQLTTIAYDESGTFTMNERRAAYTQSYRLDQVWRRQFAAKMQEEYNRTGKVTESLKDLLAYVEELPDIERAQLPEHYGQELRAKIAADFNYRDSGGVAMPTLPAMPDPFRH